MASKVNTISRRCSFYVLFLFFHILAPSFSQIRCDLLMMRQKIYETFSFRRKFGDFASLCWLWSLWFGVNIFIFEYIYICIHLQAFELGDDRRHSIWLRTILSPFEGFSAKLLMPVTWLIGDASRVSVEMFQGCKKLDTCSRHLLFTKTYDRL